MVHRIQNRNTGYSDFSGNGTSASFAFSNNNSNPISHGANALKLENEIISENANNMMAKESISEVNNQYHEELLKNQNAENIVENTLGDDETSFSQEAIENSEPDHTDQGISSDLKEFGVDTNEPDLFNSDFQKSSSEDLLGSSDDNEEDDLEIPAFLRRQKN